MGRFQKTMQARDKAATAPKARQQRPAARTPRKIVSGPGQIVEITRLGAQGDGIGTAADGQPVYVPMTLPGESWQVELLQKRGDGWQAAAIAPADETSPERQQAPCRHFEGCGGCSVQHLVSESYLNWKHQLVVDALARAGLGAAEVLPVVTSAPATRKRAWIALKRTTKGIEFGFNARRSHSLSPIEGCQVLHPALLATVISFREIAENSLFSVDMANVYFLLTDSGADIAIKAESVPTLAEREALALWAEKEEIARLSWISRQGAEPLAQRHPPQLVFGGIAVTPPPGGFTQASHEAEQQLTGAVLAGATAACPAGVSTALRIADLFSGIGTFSLALTGLGPVLAVEGDEAALAALRTAANHAIPGRVETQRRDLFADPLSAAELARFDVVVFDPPRAGARAQSEELAKSTVPTVIAVSCNPASFARDAAALIAGGYRMGPVLPVDQFHWTGHVELVCTFRR
ncbi:class I SAM-dependent RNA methyltransferase [Radicibacter daui]|uniref:class I SAM-dependent RNA methyltransferase n=1 Tax=Radicibacter daui TaxID=3064829 RepID=UPI00404702B7